jgi:hypothetical protein
MPQKTNLNISPYYDDFDKADNFYKVLFKPGYPVQARELTGLQSILQNQLESFGSHIFKEGSMVIPGGVTYDSTYFAVKINPDHLGIDVTVYLDAIINNNDGKGTLVRGQNSQIVGTIKNYILPPSEGVDDITIFVKYKSSGDSKESQAFPNKEILTLEENITYGNTTLNAGESVLTLVSEDATAIGSAVGVDKGVYFIRGTFVDVNKSLVVLEPYNNKPSYRVGFEVLEQVINANDEPSLNDNAKGFTNFAAPGADRFKISVKLTKKALLDYNDTNFIELVRVRDGEIKKLENKSVYSEIKKYFAKRTYDESGNYAVNPFRVNIQNSLNDEIGSDGLYVEGQKTDEGNDPSEDTMCVKLSPGTAYVRGFDVNLPGTTVLDVDKPRDTKSVKRSPIPFAMGSLLRVNNAQGSPYINIGSAESGGANVIHLYSRRIRAIEAKSQTTDELGAKVGEARVYWYGLTDDSYSDAATQWDLYLYDIQTYTYLEISNPGTITNIAPVSTYIRGLSSGATGYVAATNANELVLSQTSGTFIQGEQLRFNEQDIASNSSVIKVTSYTTDDIKSVYQDAKTLSSNKLLTPFAADSVLYDRILPNFSAFDNLVIVGDSTGDNGSATVANRRFAGQVGLKTDSIVGYSTNTDGVKFPTYNRVNSIAPDGGSLGLQPVGIVTGLINGEIVSGVTTSAIFRVKSPKILNFNNSGLYAKLPKKNVSTVDLSNSTLSISRQITGKSTSASGSITLTTQDALDGSSDGGAIGITSAFFETFDQERYSVVYDVDGVPEKLSSDKVTITNDGNDLVFTGLSRNSANVTINTTLKKIGLKSKSKDYIRSNQVEVTRTVGVSTNAQLTQSKFYGLRVEDKEISLNVPDVVKVLAVYESKDANIASLDSLTFVEGLALNTNSIVGEKIIGKKSRAIGQIVNRPATNTIDFVYLNGNTFSPGETVNFKESNIEANIQKVIAGNYVNRTSNYRLDKGHKKQYSDYSKIVRRANAGAPSKRLLIIFDKYKVQSGNNGDLFTANSYNKDRYTNDVPSIGRTRTTDILDFRPRVNEFDPSTTNASPFAFSSRSFETTTRYVVAPDEASIVGYTYYLPRIDKLVINKFEQVKLIKGVSAEDPAPPTEVGDSMEVAQITLPPYLYDPITEPKIKLYDNRRFTMRDIGKIEKRVSNLEVMTSLTALELDTKSLSVTDADGLDRFKTGFVVNDFKNRDFINFNREQGSRCEVDVVNKELISAVDFWSLPAELAFDPSIDQNVVDISSNLKLLDPNCKKTGDILTLDFEEVRWIEQPQASQVENINPFEVIVYVGGIILDPPSDNWTRTIYVEGTHRIESTGATWAEHQNIVSDTSTSNTDVTVTEEEIEADQDIFEGNHRDITTTRTTTTTRTVETSFTNTLENAGREFDYVESIKISGATDPFMRSRNVAFNANGLKPSTKHYAYLDSAAPDITPKVTEIQMSSGSFQNYEHVDVYDGSKLVATVIAVPPNHKYGDTNVIRLPIVGPFDSSPYIMPGNDFIGGGAMQNIGEEQIRASLTSSNISVVGGTTEKYTVDIFDSSRPAPSDSYSATSKIFNCDVNELANRPGQGGYISEGFTLIGNTSGASAVVTNAGLFSDNWGDCLGAIYFRNANLIPKPSPLFRTGTKTFRLTAAPVGTTVLPGSTALASDASTSYHATGTILTQVTNTVGVRNPPAPAQRPNEINTTISVNEESSTRRIEAPYRDPLAQSFTVDESGAFLTSFDVYFAKKDPNAKVFVELRTVELGTPTTFLVQDYAQVAINPNDIVTSDDASIATRIKFPSPVYLEAGKEYALVFLSPGSDQYEMWCATMGQKTVKTSNLPDVESVVVTKQYIGGSLFKSQNGSIWTPSQYQDLTFTLYKAAFVPSGTVTFYNTPVEAGNENTQILSDNPIRTLPRKLKLELNWPGASYTAGQEAFVGVGRKVSTGAVGDREDDSITGIVEKVSAPLALGVDAVTLISGGSGYAFSNLNGIKLKTLTGGGSGITATLTVSNGVITGIDASSGNAGTGYSVGDVLTIDETDSKYTTGIGAKFTVDAVVAKPDTLYLTDVQGENFITGETIVHYGNSNNDTRTVLTGVTAASDSVPTSDINAGNVIEVIQPNHAHHGANNIVSIKGIEPDTISTLTKSDLAKDATLVSVASTSSFARFAGVTTDRGEALLGSEVVGYVIGEGQLNITRGIEGSSAVEHPEDTKIQPYEINGFPLAGINTTFNLPTNTTLKSSSNIDNYYLEIDRGTSDRVSGKNMLCFTDEKAIGGLTVDVSQNHQFSTLSPQFNIVTPGKGTRASASVRTVSGTSADGNEVSFIDQGFEPTILNETTFFPTPRLVASKVNESQRLETLPKNKSLTLKVDMTSTDKNLSPILDIKNANFILGRNKINNPVGQDGYSSDVGTTELNGDRHGSIFVSNRVNLKQPATSIKVLVGANRQPEADFRAYYRLFTADSTEVSQSYRPFPGYNNLIDTDGDGFGDEIIDPNMSDGRPDAYVKPNGLNDFSEYQFSIDNLEQFSGFTIKIVMASTNECVPVRLKDFRAIALA